MDARRVPSPWLHKIVDPVASKAAVCESGGPGVPPAGTGPHRPIRCGGRTPHAGKAEPVAEASMTEGVLVEDEEPLGGECGGGDPHNTTAW